jgi:hypothetical protein
MARDKYHDYPQNDYPGRDNPGRGRSVAGYPERAYSRREYPLGEYPESGHPVRQHPKERYAASDLSEAGRGSNRGGYYGGGPRRPRSRRKKKNPRALIALIALLGLSAFAGGFVGTWSLGSLIVGGPGLGGGAGGGTAAVVMPVRGDAEVKPLVDLLAFRDLAYEPVKGVHFYPRKVNNTAYMEKVMAVYDTTELNAVVTSLKDDDGWLAYDSDLTLAKRYGTVNPSMGIRDVDSVLASLYQHNIIPVARLVCFKDGILSRKRPELAVQTETGDVFVDTQGSRWLNPYNHEVWEYIVQVAEELARRGFREIQLDYVRFPSAGIANATYPGRYCAKEDAIAGFLAYARPRLEALGVWVSADVFGDVLARTDDSKIGQQLEKMCVNTDIICPMVYPYLYGGGRYGVEKPVADPYRIVKAALTDLARRMPGTGTKGRPYLSATGGGLMNYTPELIRDQIRAAEELGFNEWVLWGGYLEGALQPAADGGVTVTTQTTEGVGGTTTTLGGQ